MENFLVQGRLVNASSANKDSCNSKHDAGLHVNGLSEENHKDASPQKEASNCCLHSGNAMHIKYYSFGQTAASATGELKHKLSENEEERSMARMQFLFG